MAPGLGDCQSLAASSEDNRVAVIEVCLLKKLVSRSGKPNMA
jgi:hypothetical protein